jgi:hypothetical protein
MLAPVSATAIADDGGSGSRSRHDDRDRGAKPDRLDWPDLPGPHLGPPDRLNDPPLADEGPAMRVGAGRTDQESLRGPQNLTIADSPAAAPPVAERSAAAPPIPEFGPSARSGSDRAGVPPVSIRSPRVVVGNGRPPVVRHREVQPQQPALPVAPEVVPPVPERVVVEIPAPPRVDRGHPPALVPQLNSTEAATSADPLFGLAGLVLIPAIGAALGYRQARAAQKAAR